MAHQPLQAQGLLLSAAPPPRSAGPRLNVQRAIGRAHVANSDQQHVYQRPYPQAAEAEELAEAFSPLAQVEAVRSEPAEGDAVTPNRTGIHQRPPDCPQPGGNPVTQLSHTWERLSNDPNSL